MVNELVKRLSAGKHEVVIGYRDIPYDELKQRIEDDQFILSLHKLEVVLN